ncbi:MAG: helix-turn-helix transcriptional regulator [Alphaproteobacteria bacterium]|jgi:transcriptional regulator with XRE-family HTH domain|nr:helix-turn-helix transcriptional regulator [Alphaproteobacteria bacterium]
MSDKDKKSDLDSFGARLRALRGYSRLSRSEIFRRFGIPEATLKSWEFNLQKDVSTKAVKRILHVFNTVGIPCSQEWLVFGVGVPPFYKEVSTKGPNVRKESLEKLYFEECHPKALTHTIKNELLMPYFAKGDIVGALPVRGGVYTPKLGDFCIAVTSRNEQFIGRLANGTREGEFSIVQDLSLQSPDSIIVDINLSKLYEIVWTRKTQR